MVTLLLLLQLLLLTLGVALRCNPLNESYKEVLNFWITKALGDLG